MMRPLSYYWGDAKADHRRARDDFSGNRLLSQSSIGAERWAEIPPILHFSKEQPGTVRFTGVCVLAELRQLRRQPSPPPT
ncbi:hypothetical protein [Paraliomyxa miuraensis]|uniref:hypothetical protein n=1 Tax=Paraliomyxa miuraensis TaxID=376150 RepID=UPI002252A435|nr:hypothetical protein [Paraliomyxa miuraensis]MCX4244204.1 hypothetical protein [Paraliomyxa miuraensis]